MAKTINQRAPGENGVVITLDGDEKSRPDPQERRYRPVLSVIVPTFNEADNLPILLERLDQTLVDAPYEVIVVDDDSPDQTWRVAAEIQEIDTRVRLLHRIDKRGLSSAVLDGMSLATGQVLVVIDADLQHDESIIPDLIQPVLDGNADVSVGSREVDGGSYGTFSRPRKYASVGAASVARHLLKVDASDPMSGFFAISKNHFEAVKRKVNPRGFKILLEFLARKPRPKTTEVGYTFRDRVHGSTKLTLSVVVAFLLGVVELTIGRLISARFSAYILVGAVGLAVRVLVGWGLQSLSLGSVSVGGYTLGADDFVSLLAIEASIISNYVGNNVFTFSPFAHRRAEIFTGVVKFHLVSIHSLIVHAGVVAVFYPQWETTFLFATWPQLPFLYFVSAIAVATVGNYYLNSLLTWKSNT